MIERVTFPGPPNYESVAEGDAPETYWLLDLRAPLCVEANTDYPANTNVPKIQLVFDMNHGDPYVRYRALMGQSVRASGTLFGAETGHHHTDVLLNVTTLEAVGHAQER